MLVPQCSISRNIHKKQQSDLSIPDQRMPLKQINNKRKRRSYDKNGSLDKTGNECETQKKLTYGLKNYNQIKNAYITTRVINQNINTQSDQHDFSPHVNATGKARHFNEFINSQNQFIISKENNISKIKTEINQIEKLQNTLTPKIDRRSKKISEHLNQDEVFERLSREKTHCSDAYSEQQLFTPKILNRSKKLIRVDKIQNLLYSDAERRKSHHKFVMASSRLPPLSNQPIINENTNKLVFKKIHTEFEELLEGQNSVSPIVAISVISELFNVDLNPNKDIQTENLCHQVLVYLVDDKNSKSSKKRSFSEVEISKDKMLGFITAILNIEVPSDLGNSKQLYSVEQRKQITKNLGYFYRQRLAKQRKNKNVPNQNETFCPKTLENSTKMAESHRQRKLDQIAEFMENQNQNMIVEGNLRIQDLLILDAIRKQAQIDEKRRQKKQKQLAYCSFRPSLDKKRYTEHKPKQYNTYKKFHRNLSYENKKDSSLNKQFDDNFKDNIMSSGKGLSSKRLVTEIPINETEETDRYLFKDDLLKDNKVKDCADKKRKKITIKQKKDTNTKDMEKNLLRMSMGRKVREFQHCSKQRGYAKGQNWRDLQTKMKKEICEYDKKLKGYTSQISQRKSISQQRAKNGAIRY